jgi:hypothetical protein
VGVEKPAFLEKLPKYADRKCPGHPRESLIAHPDAILFLRFYEKEFFNSHAILRQLSEFTVQN